MKRLAVRAFLGATLLLFVGLALGAALPSPAGDPPAPWETCVRIRCEQGQTASLGSGTVILSDETRTVVLTAAHVVEEPGSLTVELFDGKLVGDAQHPKVSPMGSYPATVIAFDKATDVGLVEFRPGVVIASSPIVPEGYQPAVGDKMTSVGCSEGYDATPWTCRVIGFTSDQSRGYHGTRCSFRPKQGRSGGGLFTGAWELAGVCDFAEVDQAVGVYASPGSIHKLLGQVEETGIFGPPRTCPPNTICPNQPAPAPNWPTSPPAPRRRNPPAVEAAPGAIAEDLAKAAEKAGEKAVVEPIEKNLHVIETVAFGIFALVGIGFSIHQATSKAKRYLTP